MADSVRERILQDVEATLRMVKTTNGYANTIAKVMRVDFTNPFNGPFPLALIHEPDENYTLIGSRGNDDVYQVDVNLEIGLWIEKPGASKATPMNSLLADVKKALMVDRTRGELAISTRPSRVTMSVLDETMTPSAATVSWVISYRHLGSDPATAV